MKRWLAAAVATALMGQASAPKPAADVRLYRLDCGRGTLPKRVFNDARAYPEDATVSVVASCYLIRHGADWLLWDAGFGRETLGQAQGLTQPIEPQLAAIGVSPAEIGIVGISHSHPDHTGQARAFPAATLVIGSREFDQLFGPGATANAAAAPLAAWADGKRVRKVGGEAGLAGGDLDIYGDGSVTAIALPGHTPGHLGLLVKLRRSGYVVLSGDQYHFRENRAKHGVPGFNFDRAQTLASHDRLESIVRNLRARLVIQHDPQDNAALPKAPAYLD